MERRDYQGLPVLYEDLPADPTVCLMFRVGVADEPLPQRGLTHLVEHMALTGWEDHAVQINGSVDAHVCRFWASGSPDGLWRFVDAVGEALQVTDAAALQRERGVLAVEAQGARSLQSAHYLRRYGAGGPGRIFFDELGVGRVDVDAFESWRQTYFVAANAAIWSTVEPPAGGRQPLLPTGAPVLPARRAPIRSRHGFFRLDAATVSFSAVVERSSSARIGLEVLRRRIERRLRGESGLSYSVDAMYDVTSIEQADVALFVDCEEKRASRVLAELRREMASFLEAGPTIDEIETLVKEFDVRAEAIPYAMGVLDAAARDLLFTSEVLDRSAVAQQLSDVTPDSTRDTMSALSDTDIWQLTWRMRGTMPERPDLDGPDPIPEVGNEYELAHIVTPADVSVRVMTAPGVLALRTGSSALRMDLDRVAVNVRWGDGGRHLIDERGSELLLEPTMWRRGFEVVEHVDRCVADERHIDGGFRSAVPCAVLAHSSRWWTLSRRATPFLAIGSAIVAVAIAGTAPWQSAMLGVVAVALFTSMWLDTRVREPTVYEVAGLRADDPSYPDDAAPEDAARWGAPILLWARVNGHLEPPVTEFEPDVWREFDAGVIDATEAFWRIGGLLASDMFSAAANEFMYDFVLGGTWTRRRVGLGHYVPLLDGIAHASGATTFCGMVDEESLVEARRAIAESFRRWQRFRSGHRVIRMFVLGEHSRLGAGDAIIRSWRRFRFDDVSTT